MIRSVLGFLVALSLLAPVLALADDPADSLFVNPDPDSKADTTQKVTFDPFTGQNVRFFENLSVDAYLVSGYEDNGTLLTTPADSLTFGFGSDVRLDRTARAYASFNLAYPDLPTQTANLYNPIQTPVGAISSTQLTFSNLNIKELFLDYALGTAAIIRIGRQSATWGQGRIFNPGNLLEDINDGMAAKVSVALGPVAVTAITIKNDTEYGTAGSSAESLGVGSLAWAFLAEYSANSYSVGLSGFYHALVGEKVDAYLKTSVWGSDVFGEALAEQSPSGVQSVSGVVGLYREFGENQKYLKLQAEWLVSGRGNTGKFANVSNPSLGFNDQTFGIGATTELLSFIQTKPSILWLQTLSDYSGQLTFGLVNSTLPHLDMTLGVNHVYGSPGSRYIVNNPDSYGRVWSLSFKISFHFDLNN